MSELSASSPHLRPDSNIFSLEMDLFNPLVANLINTGCSLFHPHPSIFIRGMEHSFALALALAIALALAHSSVSSSLTLNRK